MRITALAAEAQFDGPISNISGRVADSLAHFQAVLEDPDGFNTCTDMLYDIGTFFFPNSSENGFGAIKKLSIQEYSCTDLSCTVQDDPFEGGEAICGENPNWKPGHAADDFLTGIGSPQSGMITIAGGGENSECPVSPSVENTLSYRRYVCEDEKCLFVLTGLSFNLADDVEIGPLTFHSPSVALNRPAFGTIKQNIVRFGEQSLVMDITASVSLGPLELFNGAELPFQTSNLLGASLIIENGTAAFSNSIFPLFANAHATLNTEPTSVEEQ